MSSKNKNKGRGVTRNPRNRFERNEYAIDDWRGVDIPDEKDLRTVYLEIAPKTIVNKVTSPDVGMDYSLNPYQGCEHGCTYCYARPTHEYWGYSAGLDFEQTIMVKKNAPDLLRETFNKKSWKVKPIVLSGNTDCYQPAEKKFEITRRLLEVFLEYRHPVGIITKNALMQRDLDLIEELAKYNLIAVNVSITSLNEELRRKLEPRTATSKRKLQLVQQLSEVGVPVNVMAAPIIPGLNDHEILALGEAAAQHGAHRFHAHLVRLMGPNEQLFDDWVRLHFPDRAQKVMNQIRSVHGGRTGNSNFGERMKGTGNIAENVRRMKELAQNRYFNGRSMPALRTDLFRRPNSNGQLGLFDS